MLKRSFYFLLCLVFFVFACKKKKTDQNEGITAGDTDSEFFISSVGVNKTLEPSIGKQEEYLVDLNKDGSNDIKFLAKNKVKDGKYEKTELTLNCLGSSEVMMVDTNFENRIFTAKFKKGALIATFFPFENSELIFSSSIKDTTNNVTRVYCDWCNVIETYFAFRIKRSNSDNYQIGWVELSVPDSACNKIQIRSWACRR